MQYKMLFSFQNITNQIERSVKANSVKANRTELRKHRLNCCSPFKKHVEIVLYFDSFTHLGY